MNFLLTAGGMIASMAIILFLYGQIMPLFLDYTFGRDGIRIVLFRRWTIYHLRRNNISRVLIRRQFEYVGGLPFHHIRLNNRFKLTTLVVQSTGKFSLTLTPKDPNAAVSAPGL